MAKFNAQNMVILSKGKLITAEGVSDIPIDEAGNELDLLEMLQATAPAHNFTERHLVEITIDVGKNDF